MGSPSGDNYIYTYATNNNAPVLTGNKGTLPDMKPGENFILKVADLTKGFSDPEGDPIYLGNMWTEYGYWHYNDDLQTGGLPIAEGIFLEIDEIISYTLGSEIASLYIPEYIPIAPFELFYDVIDINGGRVETSTIINVVPDHSFSGGAFTPNNNDVAIPEVELKEYTSIESEGNITLVKDQDNYGYVQDASGNKQAITYDGEQIQLGMWEEIGT